MGKIKNLTGQRFGKLTAVAQTSQRFNNRVIWKCQCDCGQIKFTNSGDLQSGNVRSCGCLAAEMHNATAKSRSLKHKHTAKGKTSRTYKSWDNM